MLMRTTSVHSASRSLHKKRLSQEAYASLREQTALDLSGRGGARPPLVGAESNATSIGEEGSDASSLYSGPSIIKGGAPSSFHRARVATLHGEKTVV